MTRREGDEREDETRPDLKAAVRRARIDLAAHSGAVDDLRRAEIARLEILEQAMRPIVADARVDLFDLGLSLGEKPRLFLDMIAYVDMGPDRRTYRFHQNTRHGRVLIAENANAGRIVTAMTNYVARRLIEREQALASDERGAQPPAAPVAGSDPARPRRSGAWLDVIGFLLMALGAFTLFALAALAVWLLFSGWGHAILAANFGAVEL